MTPLVEIFHPPTGRLLYMHPDLAAQRHHWIHPDPAMPTPPESLPLFEVERLRAFARDYPCFHSTPAPAAVLVKAGANDR